MTGAGTIPFTILTGFLGSGKTTLLSGVLTDPAFAATLVVVNEFGEIGIDHDLIEASSDDTILLANGCLCCTIRGNLVDTLTDALAQVESGRLGAFDRVVVETSGLADPLALLGFVLGEASVTSRYRLDAVITVVDPSGGGAQLAQHPEALAQILAADRVIVSKTDLAPPERVAETEEEIRRLNPAAEIATSRPGAIAPALFLAPARPVPKTFAHDHHDHGGHDHDHHKGAVSASYRFAEPMPRARVEELARALAPLLDARTLRVKAILPLAYDAGSAVVQAVADALSPVGEVAARPEDGRLVVIARDRDLADIDALVFRLGGERRQIVS